ncbi:MAG: hypothetical protein GY850_25595 [bacterium]|nr:hypothetical protein [bacterium]
MHVKEAWITPEKAARYMAKCCACGAFNASRAVRILNEDRLRIDYYHLKPYRPNS